MLCRVELHHNKTFNYAVSPFFAQRIAQEFKRIWEKMANKNERNTLRFRTKKKGCWGRRSGTIWNNAKGIGLTKKDMRDFVFFHIFLLEFKLYFRPIELLTTTFARCCTIVYKFSTRCAFIRLFIFRIFTCGVTFDIRFRIWTKMSFQIWNLIY